MGRQQIGFVSVIDNAVVVMYVCQSGNTVSPAALNHFEYLTIPALLFSLCSVAGRSVSGAGSVVGVAATHCMPGEGPP